MYRPMGHGFIEVIVGPMYSGKSEELIRRLKRSKIAKQEVIVFKPIIDDRYHKEDVVSHSGIRMRAITIENPEEMFDYVNEEVQVVGIDEINFFPDELVDVCLTLADRGIRVIAAGLDMDFRGVPFGAVPHLMARAEFVDKLQAVCLQCGAPATRTQRLIDQMPASYDDPIILVGADESYEARCRKCHQVLGGPDHVK